MNERADIANPHSWGWRVDTWCFESRKEINQLILQQTKHKMEKERQKVSLIFFFLLFLRWLWLTVSFRFWAGWGQKRKSISIYRKTKIRGGFANTTKVAKTSPSYSHSLNTWRLQKIHFSDLFPSSDLWFPLRELCPESPWKLTLCGWCWKNNRCFKILFPSWKFPFWGSSFFLKEREEVVTWP